MGMNKEFNKEASLRKTQQLGMDHGTANHRLRKMFMFHMAKQLGMLTCFRCGKEIETCDEMSIDHKQPWLYEDTRLFWDMDNLALSHLKCNVGASRNGVYKHNATSGEQKRKYKNQWTAWCNQCKTFKSKSKFSKNAKEWNGLQNRCNDCRKLRSKKHHSVK